MQNKSNQKIRRAIYNADLRHYEIAKAMGVRPETFCRWLKTELPKGKKEKIMRVIREMQP